MLSGNIWHSVACRRLSVRLTAVQPTNLPAARSATVPLLLTMMLGLSGKVSFTSPPCWEWITKPVPLALATVPANRISPANGFAGADELGAWARSGPAPAAHTSSPTAAIRGLRDMNDLLNALQCAPQFDGVYVQTDAAGISLHPGSPHCGK